MQSSMMHTQSDIDQRTCPVELRKRILKLRWIGEETEAERLCAILGQAAHDHIVVDELPMTD
jgi:hypothetical protein